MAKTLHKEWVKFLLEKFNEIEAALTKPPANELLQCKLALIDLRSVRRVILDHALDDVTVETVANEDAP